MLQVPLAEIAGFDSLSDFFEALTTYVTSTYDPSELFIIGAQHFGVVLVSVAIAIVIGVGIGILSYRSGARSTASTAITGTILTIPSFALLVLLVPLPGLGLGLRTAIVALVAYALLPIVRNTITGLNGVDPAVLDAARGTGFSRGQILRRVELPLAMPVIIAGIRVSTQIIVGIAAIAAYVQGPGFGNLIFDGQARLGIPSAFIAILVGTVGTVLVALVFDALYAVVNKLTVSKGIRD